MAKELAASKVARKPLTVLELNPDPIGREKTDEELKTQVTALGELGRGLNTIGMKLGIHHHLPEMANKAREFHYNFRNTKPEEAGFCYDVHWVWKGGVSPMEALKEYGHRVATWHLRQSRNGIWWEDLDTGDIDYGAVAEYAREHKLPRVSRSSCLSRTDLDHRSVRKTTAAAANYSPKPSRLKDAECRT